MGSSWALMLPPVAKPGIVVIPDPLAPVATMELSVLAGGNESALEYPGMAHAQERMAFRPRAGCNLTS